METNNLSQAIKYAVTGHAESLGKRTQLLAAGFDYKDKVTEFTVISLRLWHLARVK